MYLTYATFMVVTDNNGVFRSALGECVPSRRRDPDDIGIQGPKDSFAVCLSLHKHFAEIYGFSL
jgi:hypothetical protein